MSGVWLEARPALPFVSWFLNGSSFYYESGGSFWYNAPSVLIEDGERRFSRRCSVDTERGRNRCDESTWEFRTRPYLQAYAGSARFWDDVTMYWELTDYDAQAAVATIDPTIPRGSTVRLTIVVQNDREARWQRLPRLHIQFNPPIPPLERAAEWDVMLPRCGLRWEEPAVYHWVPGALRPTGEEVLVLPTAMETTITHEFRTDVDIAALGIAFEFGDGLNVYLAGQSTAGIPVPWTQAEIVRIEYLPPRALPPVRRVLEFDRDWSARIARTRQVVGS